MYIHVWYRDTVCPLSNWECGIVNKQYPRLVVIVINIIFALDALAEQMLLCPTLYSA